MGLNLRPHHVAISVKDIDNSIEFYEKLGFRLLYKNSGNGLGVSSAQLKLNDFILEIFCFPKNKDYHSDNIAQGNDIEKVGVKHLALNCDDIGETYSKLKKLGLLSPNSEIKLSKSAGFKYMHIPDPDGYWVEIVQDDRGY